MGQRLTRTESAHRVKVRDAQAALEQPGFHVEGKSGVDRCGHGNTARWNQPESWRHYPLR